MFPNGAVFTPTDTVYGVFNTYHPDTGLAITLAGTPALRLERNRSGTWSEITGAGITLRVDEDDTGRHEFDIDLDDANIAAQSGDIYRVAFNAGTVDGDSVVGFPVAYFYVQSDGLTSAQSSGVASAVDTSGTAVRVRAVVPAQYQGTLPGTGNAAGSLNLSGLGLGSSEIVNHWIMVYDASEDEQHYRLITAFDGTTATLHSNLPFTPEDSVDTFAVLAMRADQMSLSTAGVTAAQSGLATAASLSDIASALMPVSTTIATLSSQISWTLTAGSADNDAYNGWIAVIQDASTSTQYAVGVVNDYVGSTKTVTLAADPGIFTIATTDKVRLIPPTGVFGLNGVKVIGAGTSGNKWRG